MLKPAGRYDDFACLLALAFGEAMLYLLRSFSLIFVLILFYVLKKTDVMPDAAGAVVQKIVINVTIPATIISSFGSYEKEGELLLTSAYFMLLLLICMALAWLFFRKKGRDSCGFAMINSNGYNIGSLSIPIIQNFYGDYGVMASCVADIGNALMANGGTYAITNAVMKHRKGDGVLQFLKELGIKLLKSPPFDCYILLAPLLIMDISVPPAIVTLLAPIASAGSFMSMAMVGLSIGKKMSWQDIKSVAPVLLYRMGFGLATAAITYFLLPFSQTIREILTLLCVSPMVGLAVISTERYGGDTEKSGLVVSASIVMGIVQMLLLSSVFQMLH